MFPPRIRKVFRDLLGSKGRTILVILAIAVGVFAFGSVFITQELLLKNINDSFAISKPSTISISLSDFDSSVVSWAKNQKGVSDAQGKALQSVKVEQEGKEELITLISVPDYSMMNLNLLIPKKGSWPPQKGEIALERNSYISGKYTIGDILTIKNFKDKANSLFLTGEVYDNSVIPYIFTRQMTGFISWDTLAFLGYPKKFNQLEIAVRNDIKDLNDAENLTNILTDQLKARGLNVNGVNINKPGQHWATDNSKAFTAILSVIGSFSLVLSGFLVVNTISALLAQQKKQIGIMKAIGARQGQLTYLYLLMVGIYGLLALFLALPIGMALGYFFLKLVTDFLNLDINSYYLPPLILFMEVVAALIVPLISAIVPIIQGAKSSVRNAISEYQSATKVRKIDRLLAKFSGLSRPVLLSLRNVFRKTGRLTLTLGTLVVAGALFISVINVRTGMYKEMDRILSMYDFQVSLSLANDANIENIKSRLTSISQVSEIEARNHVAGKRIKPDGNYGSEFNIAGLPPTTPFSRPTLLSGRWLSGSDKNDIVLSSAFTRDNKDILLGDDLLVEIGNEKYHFNVIGVIAMSGGGGETTQTFVNFDEVSRIKDTPSLASSYLIKTNPDDAKTQSEVADNAQEILKRGGITVVFKQIKNDIIASAANQFNFMIFFLLAMAVMVAVVGGLGLAGTMSLNVMERTREIGIMRSIGANDKAIRRLVLIEGLLVGLLSFILAIPISLPLTWGFCSAIGNAFFGRTLVFIFVPAGAAIWFLIITIIAVIASVLPARRASKISISETLSYE